MDIKLNDGKTFEVLSYQKNSFEMTIPFNKIYDTAVLMNQNNVSNAKIIDSSTGKETILYQFKEVMPLGFETKIVDELNVTIRFEFEEISETEIELAKQKAEAEAVSHFIALGLQNAEIKDVIMWAKFLDDWNAFKFPYKKGERFKFKGNPYEVVEAVTSSEYNTPDKDSKHYKLLKASENSQDKPKVEIKPWDEKHTYNKGDLAIARGIVFVSKIDGNKGNEPGFGTAWDYYKN
jgi:hypothetical protein|nr:MAG TPA: hypothetical protein [Caudoviricetes sp.]DAX16032.1 MAG TPA: hypothetical protein [Caudoviricetes sp.]